MATVSAVQFDAESHIYRDGDEIVPSVTQCLELAGICPTVSTLPAMVQRNYERAAAIGTEVHRCCELLDKDDLVLESMDELVLPYVVAYQKFKEEAGFQPRLIEHRGITEMWGLQYGYCVDRVGPLDGLETVIDIKTAAKPSDSWAIQTCAYSVALGVPGRTALHVNKEAQWRLIPYNEDMQDLLIWEATLKVAHWKLKHGAKLR